MRSFENPCVEQTDNQPLPAKDVPDELQYRERRDAFHRRVTNVVDMGERTLDLLLRFLQQGHGSLPGPATKKEFALLTPDEVARIETIYSELF